MAAAIDKEPADGAFPDDEEFLRRIPHFQFNYQTGRPHSKAFRDASLSVNRRRLTTIEDTQNDPALSGDVGVVSLTAKLCYDNRQLIIETPTSTNRAHCDVVGPKPGLVATALRDGCTQLVDPMKLLVVR